MYMQGAAGDEAWIAATEQQNPGLWRSYRLCHLREERWINQPGASSSHSIEAVAYRVYGRQGCICLQHRPHLVLAVDAAIDPGALPAALSEEQIGAVTAMTDPHQGLSTLPGSYTQVLDLYRHSFLFPDTRCLLPQHIARLEQHWSFPMRSCTPSSS